MHAVRTSGKRECHYREQREYNRHDRNCWSSADSADPMFIVSNPIRDRHRSSIRRGPVTGNGSVARRSSTRFRSARIPFVSTKFRFCTSIMDPSLSFASLTTVCISSNCGGQNSRRIQLIITSPFLPGSVSGLPSQTVMRHFRGVSPA